MRKKNTNFLFGVLLSLFLFVFTGSIISSSAYAFDSCRYLHCSDEQVLLCHHPELVTISVPEEIKVRYWWWCKCIPNPDIDTHLDHGDYLGECVPSPNG